MNIYRLSDGTTSHLVNAPSVAYAKAWWAENHTRAGVTARKLSQSEVLAAQTAGLAIIKARVSAEGRQRLLADRNMGKVLWS